MYGKEKYPSNNGVFEFQYVSINGIRFRLVTVKKRNTQQKRMNQNKPILVMFLHGWPESWYSWRHQMIALADEGYFVCAPDMRGYGGSSIPDQEDNVFNYNIHTLVKDIVDIAQFLMNSSCKNNNNDKVEPFVIVGHDFGAYLSWHIALLRPECVLAICAMSVPYVGHSPSNCDLLTKLKRKYHFEDHKKSKYQYMLYHCLPFAAEEYQKNTKEALYRLYAYHPGVPVEEGTPEVTNPLMFIINDDTNKKYPRVCDARIAPGCWKRIPRPKSLPTWLPIEDFNYYVSEYEKYGFSGGLKWYQALEINWHATRFLRCGRNDIIQQPVLFIAGEEDAVITLQFGGKDAVCHGLKQHCVNPKQKFIFYPHAGHWIQQEHSTDVNHHLLQFLSECTASFNKTAHYYPSKL